MANLNDLAADLFGTRRLESGVRTGGTNNSSGISGGSRTSNGGSSLSSTVGLATSDSQDGKVTVRISDYTTTSDVVFDDSVLGPEIEIGTTVNVKAGQYVHITLINHDKGSQPIVMGVIGGGDEMNSRIEQAEEDLKKAEDDLYGPEGHPEQGIVQRVEKAAKTVDAVNKQLNGDPEDPDDHGIVGQVDDLDDQLNKDGGLVDQVKDVDTVLNGDPQDPDDHGLVGEVGELDTTVNNEIKPRVADALYSLGTVENVVDTLNWITQHGEMTLTSDTSPMPNKVYFVEDPNGEYQVAGERYSIVINPEDPIPVDTYFELGIKRSINNYISTHLVLANDGLHIIGENERLVIGESEGFHVTITPTELAFCDGLRDIYDEHGIPIGKEDNWVAKVTNNELHIPRAIITDSVTVGHYRWVELTNGNFALKYLTEEGSNG